MSGVGEPVLPAAYSAQAVLVSIGAGDGQRTRPWEGNDDAVVGNVEGVVATMGAAEADFSDARDAVGGRAAFTVPDDRSRTEVHQLRNGDGNPVEAVPGDLRRVLAEWQSGSGG